MDRQNEFWVRMLEAELGARRRRITRILKFVLVLAGLIPASRASSIPVPNGDFTSAANNGSIGGGILTLSGSGVIGSGPWSGTYNAVLGLLVPPALAINDLAGGGTATISGVAGVTITNIDNGGFFSDTLTGILYQPFTAYTLTAQVDADVLLSAGLLSSDGVGIGLTHGGAALADTTNPICLLSLSLLSDTDYQVQLLFTTGATSPSGDIGVVLFDQPSHLATANLLQSVTFRDVTLDATAVPEPGYLMLSGLALVGAGLFVRKRKS